MRRSSLFCLASLVLTGCGDEPAAPAGPDIHLAVVSGDGQIGFANQTLTYPIVVRVLGPDTAIPLREQRITFAVIEGGGTVEPAAVVSDRYGLGSTTWTLGDVGPQRLEVRSVSATGDTASLSFSVDAWEQPYRGERIDFYWTVNGQPAASACPDSGFVTIRAELGSYGGAPCRFGRAQVPFAMPGSYQFELSLDDGQRTSTVGDIDVTVIRGRSVSVDTIDFTF